MGSSGPARAQQALVDHKAYRRGTHRGRTPVETFEVMRRWMPLCGITRIANITGLDRVGVPVFVAVRPNSRGLTTSQGKGLDPEAARTSALMESLEGWHGERVQGTTAYARAGELESDFGSPAVDLRPLHRRGPDLGWTEHTRITWIRGRDLCADEEVFVPYDCVSTDFTADVSRSPFVRTTNGLASGNSYEEAALHAIYEVVERDAVTMWSRRPEASDLVVDLDSIRDSYNAEILDRLRTAGLDVMVRLMTADTQVPVLGAFIAPGPRWQTPPFASFSGYGAHLDPQVALARALTEAVQSRLTMIHGSRDDLWPSQYARVLDHRAAATWTTHVAMAEPTLSFEQVPDRSSDSFTDDLALVVDLVEAIVPRVVIADLTRDDIGVPVVKAVVPGLAGIPFDERPRYGGRHEAIPDGGSA